MGVSVFNKDIKYLPGVGPKRAKLLREELNITTYGDLLYYFPYKHVDRTVFYNIRDLQPGMSSIQLRGKIKKFDLAGKPNKRRLIAYFADQTGVIELVWFKGISWIRKNHELDKEYVIFGKPSLFNQKLNMVHPEIESAEKYHSRVQLGFEAHYNTTERLKKNYVNSRAIRKLQNNLLLEIKDSIGETMPEHLRDRLRLFSLRDALLNIHFPDNQHKLRMARYRLKFEELFYIQLNILRQRTDRIQKFSGFIFQQVGELFNAFYHHHLPFELTSAQKRVLKEIRKDLGSGQQMNRLLQGDVGSGKTLVALMSILIALDNGYQTCIMAPTEILAHQHFQSIRKFIGDLYVDLRLLTGSTPEGSRKEIHDQLRSGELDILIGTHALTEETVQFHNLGLVVIDEQHRFGVAQRASLWKKNTHPPHILVMTATPIPRTLAMTVYGDLDVSVIDELPPGRKPVKTAHFYESKRHRVVEFMRKMIHQGRQVFVVYPLISESEKLDLKNLEEGYDTILRYFPPPRYAVSVVHGRMKPEEKDKAMELFVKGKTHIMVSTTVIEVGVDVPNASVMVVENAERFGLSQLHQLRGRIGRGEYQSCCLLMSSDKLSDEAKKRIETMVRSNDGFEIAEADLKLRGPGDIEGTQQSGIPFDLKIANLGQDNEILNYARKMASEVLEEDPGLEKEKYQVLVEQLKVLANKKKNYSVVS